MAKQISKMEQLTVTVERVKNTSDGFSVYTAREEGTLLPPRTVKQFCGPVRSQQRWVLSREWLYTVITRARERCYLIGDVNAIQSCIKVQRSQERRTGLVEAIARTA